MTTTIVRYDYSIGLLQGTEHTLASTSDYAEGSMELLLSTCIRKDVWCTST